MDDAAFSLLDAATDHHRKLVQEDGRINLEEEYAKGFPFAYNKQTGEPVRARFSGTTHVGLFASSGNGKTVIAKRLLTGLFGLGWNAIHASDIKNDMADLDNKGGLSKELQEQIGLFPGETPQPVPKKMYAPKPLYDKYKTLPGRSNAPYYLTPFTLGFEDLEREELKYLIMPNPSDVQDNILDNLLDMVEVSSTSFKELIGLLQDLKFESMNPQSFERVQNALSALQTKKVLGNRLQKNPFQYLESHVIVFSMKNYSKFTVGDNREGLEQIEIFITVLLRKLSELVLNGEIKGNTVILFDESHVFLPAGFQSLVKQVVQTFIDVVARQADITLIFSTQRPSKLPHPDSRDEQNFLGSLDHILLGPDLDEPEWKRVLRSTNLYNQYYLQRWRDKFNQMEQYDFLYVNPEKHQSVDDCPIVRGYAPACAHTG